MSCPREQPGGWRQALEELRKKHLTKAERRGKIAYVPPLRRAGRVPCKLNNVTNEKHQSSLSVMDNDEDRCEGGVQSITRWSGKEQFEAEISFNRMI